MPIPTLGRAPLVATAGLAAAALAAATLASSGLTAPQAHAASAAKPVLSVSGLPVGKIGGVNSPYTETGTSVDLHLTYNGGLPNGAKLQLLVKKSYTSPWVASKTPIKLAAGAAKIKVTSSGIGGPYSYEVAVVSVKARLAVSKTVGIYWAQPPGGVFVEQGSQSAFTSTHNAKENCEAGCQGVANPEETTEVAGLASPTPMPATWTVTLIYNGQVVCSTKDIEGECRGNITFPAVSTTTTVPLVGQITSPSGKVTKATMLVTLYP